MARETFKFSTDPELEAKVRDEVGAAPAPPQNAIVLGVDIVAPPPACREPVSVGDARKWLHHTLCNDQRMAVERMVGS